MSIGIIAITVLFILGFTVIFLCVKTHKQLKKQELINLINDMSYEISKSNFNGTRYTFSFNENHMLIPLDKEVITEDRERTWNFKSYSYSISIMCKKDPKCIILIGIYGSFEYVKSIGIP